MAENSNSLPPQPTVNLGLVGHVDHGKTTLTKLLSGMWTDTHSQEMKKGITIKLGYTNFVIYYDKEEQIYKVKNKEEKEENLDPQKKFSIVDSPGHESFMATMISGAAVMDYAVLLVAADENCPRPQTIEHIRTLEIAGIENIVVVQNKVDLVSREEAIENFHQIQEFLKSTKYANAPVIPMSAEYGANLSPLLGQILESFEEPTRDTDATPVMNIVRSFDINKPGDSFENLKGGVLGGTIKHGMFHKDDEIEIRPGLSHQKDGKVSFTPIYTTIDSLATDKIQLNEATAGGSVAVATSLDPAVTKSDSLLGHIVGKKGTLPEPSDEITFDVHLMEKVITNNNEYDVKQIVKNEPLMLIVNSMTTVGIVTQANPDTVTVSLKRPVMAFNNDRVVIFRGFEKQQWRIIGHGIINYSNGSSNQ